MLTYNKYRARHLHRGGRAGQAASAIWWCWQGTRSSGEHERHEIKAEVVSSRVRDGDDFLTGDMEGRGEAELLVGFGLEVKSPCGLRRI